MQVKNATGPTRRVLQRALLAALCAMALTSCSGPMIGMLDPKGIIAHEERKLFFDTLALMLIVVLPVIVMSFTFVYHYRASHRLSEYKPNWSHSHFLESLWWGIPCVIIFILAILTWKKTHSLDPYRIIVPNQEPILIEAIALPWKWLFIYPQQNIATINYLALPVDQQVEFWMTADNVPMSAFFIPQLGSQIYVMAGMRTRMYLLANHAGTYEGLNAQYNGAGFSDMHFVVHALNAEDMATWSDHIKLSATHLDQTAYQTLLAPQMNVRPQFFSGVTPNLFEDVMKLYMHSVGPLHPRANIPTMDSNYKNVMNNE
jgi:cytochrome o ubiquinol oxidase subunit 2